MTFLPTPSARRATKRQSVSTRPFCISTHALREEGDLFHDCGFIHSSPISTHALREEGDVLTCWVKLLSSFHFYPRPPRGGRPGGAAERNLNLFISTHALREEGDYPILVRGDSLPISTHALREEGDLL